MGMRKRHMGFTLGEILIVVIILGILGAIVLPQFSEASDDAKESALIQSLQTTRAQVELYKFHHNGEYPATKGGSSQDFADQMCKASDQFHKVGEIGDATCPLGPYFVKFIPVNPYNGGRAVKIVDDVPSAAVDEEATETVDGKDEKVGWFFNPATGRLKANASGNAADGTKLEGL